MGRGRGSEWEWDKVIGRVRVCAVRMDGLG